MTTRGTVKWFNPAKGYGFINGEDGRDYFVHYTDIQKEGYKALADDDTVEFETVKDEKGYKAVNVREV